MSGSSSVRAGGRRRPALITGGAGFVGTNLADRLLRARAPGPHLRQPGAARRRAEPALAAWRSTRRSTAGRVADLRDRERLAEAVADIGTVFHLAAQVAVTTSLDDPPDDFAVNAARHARTCSRRCARTAATARLRLHLDQQGLWRDRRHRCSRRGPRYEPLAELGRWRDRRRPAARLPQPLWLLERRRRPVCPRLRAQFRPAATVFRMSCIYGPHQHGTEDQGWVAHFMIRAADGQPITIYGDGKQVRDCSVVDDLVEAFLLRRSIICRSSPDRHSISAAAAEFLQPVGAARSYRAVERRAARRSSSATGGSATSAGTSPTPRKFVRATGWQPQVGVDDGVAPIARLVDGEPGGAAPLGRAAL